jgi:hypothetical protein
MDCSRHTFSFGLGYYGLLNGLLDITSVFQYVQFITRTIDTGESENLGGFKKYTGTVKPYNDFPLEFGGHIINLGIVLGIHY